MTFPIGVPINISSVHIKFEILKLDKSRLVRLAALPNILLILVAADVLRLEEKVIDVNAVVL